MDREERIAYINSQVACMYAEMYAMIADNAKALHEGLAPIWDYQEFMDLQNKYCVGHNAVVGYLSH